MNDPKLSYFEKEDILHLAISNEKEFGSVEVSPNITSELNEDGELIGVEIIGASSFSDSRMKEIKSAITRFEQNGIHVTGTIMNDVDMKSTGKTHDDYYYYAYK